MRKLIEESCLGRAVQLIYVDENGNLKTDPEAISALHELKGPVAVVSLFGKALNGKSFIWNQLLSRSIGFEVQTLHRPCTGDIWMWIEPVKRISQDGTEYNLVLLDVEGADSLATQNNKILSLAILLSSVFIYGPLLGVDNIVLDDLSGLLEISKHEHIVEAKDNTFPGLGQFSPMFVQLMKENSSEDVTQNNKHEILQPEFLYGINALVKFVFERVRPKQRSDTIVTGPPLASFTKSFSENVNKNVVLGVSSLWQSAEELEACRARDTATEVYMSSLKSSETPEESMLIEAHNKAIVKALNAFCESSIGNNEVKQKYKRDLWKFFAKAFEDHKRVANIEAYSRCCNAIEEMGKKLWALPCSLDANIGDMIKALDIAVTEYEESINGPMKWQKLSSFLRKSIQDILVHRRENQIDELLSENSKLKLQHRSMGNAMDLLKKQLEGGEKMKKEYQKRYESAIDDMNKLSDQFKERIYGLESKCKSIRDEHSNFVGVDASISSCREQIDWKMKYESIVSEQKAGLEKITEMEERLKQGLVTEADMRAEKEKIITEKATLEQELASTRSELKKLDEYSLEAKEMRLKFSALNSEHESLKSRAKLLETETEMLKREKDELQKNENKLQTSLQEKCVEINRANNHIEDLEKLCSKLKSEGSEASSDKELVDSMKMEVEASRRNENKLQTLLEDKCRRVEELEKVCSKLKDVETESATAKELVSSMKIEAEASKRNENKLQTLLKDKCIEIERAERRVEELEKICSKLKDVETEKELVSSMKMETEKLQTLLKDKCIEVERSEKRVEELEKVCSKFKDVETEATTAKELVNSMKMEVELARINEENLKIEIERAKARIDDLERQKNMDEATPHHLVKRLKVEETTRTYSGSGFGQEDDDAVSKDMIAMTPRRCTNTEGGASSDHSKYTMKTLKSEILKHGFEAELVVLKNPRKRDLVELYERCVLRK